MKMLVTGFTPFGGEQINPSWEAARRLPNRIGGAELIKHEIPTEFDASGTALHKLLTELHPDAVLCVGQYGGANCIRVERVAINLRDARIADNAGKQPTDEPVVAGGPDAYLRRSRRERSSTPCVSRGSPLSSRTPRARSCATISFTAPCTRASGAIQPRAAALSTSLTCPSRPRTATRRAWVWK